MTKLFGIPLNSTESHGKMIPIPAYVINNMCRIVTMLAHHKPSLLRTSLFGEQLNDMIIVSTSLLRNSERLPSVTVTAALLTMLRALCECGHQSNRNVGVTGEAAAADGELALAVLMNTMAEQQLGPSLAVTYCKVDAIEGMDVDKEDFDKYTVKMDIAVLVKRIWVMDAHRKTMLSAVSRDEFVSFVRALLDQLLFAAGSAFTMLGCVLCVVVCVCVVWCVMCDV